jgi:hypothetical protein
MLCQTELAGEQTRVGGENGIGGDEGKGGNNPVTYAAPQEL